MGPRYSSLQFLSRFQAELDRLFRELSDLGDNELPTGDWLPPVDIVETASSIVILAELPGISAGDLRLEVKGSCVVLSGSKPTDPLGMPARFHCMERSRGRFQREIQLSVAVNTHLGKARLEGGILTVELPKITEQRRSARILEIEEGKKTA